MSMRQPVVLVAEDDADIRALVARTLTRAGNRVVEAADGEQALRLALELRPDLVVLDGAMPRVDGFEVARQLQRQLGGRLPVIMLTARSHEREVVEGLAAGALDYLVKPFSPADLVARVRAIVGG
jgi:two-component system phosphate regulon response regulator PhoB